MFYFILKEVETIVLDTDSEATDNNKQPTKTSQTNKSLRPKSAKRNNKTKSTGIGGKRKSKPFSKSSADKAIPLVKANPEVDHENIEVSDDSDDGGKVEDEQQRMNLEESVLSDNDNEADDERDNLIGKSADISSDVGGGTSITKSVNAKQSEKAEKIANAARKDLTPKQLKLMEQRRKAREEKERKIQEEKLKKQVEKEEKELARKREREEKEEQKRKEREEKEEQKRKEREEKDRKRLAEIEAKNEEKRRKTEAKEEEMRKRDEERKRKELEKEEAELKKKKAAQAFTKFFVAKTPSNNQIRHEEDSNTGDGAKILAFRPFQIKGDMKLAPILRKNLTADAKTLLDDFLGCKSTDNDHDDGDNGEVVRHKPLSKSQLYLAELRSGKTTPGRWRRASTESKDDVILVGNKMCIQTLNLITPFFLLVF